MSFTAQASKRKVKKPIATFEQGQLVINDQKWDPKWTEYLRATIPDDSTLLTQTPNDIQKVCPNYVELSKRQKKDVWIFLMYAIAKSESDLNPGVRYEEKGIPGNDAVTGNGIVSEGLLQVSYQDAKYYECRFDWSADSELDVKDPTRTILDPARNLQCGIQIMQRQIKKHNSIFIKKNAYWAVLRGIAGSSSKSKSNSVENSLSKFNCASASEHSVETAPPAQSESVK